MLSWVTSLSPCLVLPLCAAASCSSLAGGTEPREETLPIHSSVEGGWPIKASNKIFKKRMHCENPGMEHQELSPVGCSAAPRAHALAKGAGSSPSPPQIQNPLVPNVCICGVSLASAPTPGVERERPSPSGKLARLGQASTPVGLIIAAASLGTLC